MEWDAVGAVGEVIGALAVVVSLIYVGIQVRQNTVSQNGLMHQQLVSSQNEANRTLIENSEIAELLNKANEDLESLATNDRNRLQWLYINFINLWNVAYANHRRGLLEKHVVDEWDRGYTHFFRSNAGLWKVWEQYLHISDPSFQEHMKSVLLEQYEASPNKAVESDT